MLQLHRCRFSAVFAGAADKAVADVADRPLQIRPASHSLPPMVVDGDEPRLPPGSGMLAVGAGPKIVKLLDVSTGEVWQTLQPSPFTLDPDPLTP